MGFFGRLFGDENDDRRYRQQQPAFRSNQAARSDDEIAVERYRYLLRTAPPDAIEQVHEEAFAKLTPEQRRMVFEQLKAGAAPTDRPAYDDPRSLARAATRSEMRQPGFLERTFGGGGGYGGGGFMRSGPSFGSMLGGSLLGSIAGVVIGSAIADALMPGIGDLGNDFAGAADLGADAGGFDGGGGYDGGAEQAGFDGGGGGDWFGGGGDFGGGMDV